MPVAPELVRRLRKEALRPGRPIDELVFDRDLAAGAMHAAVLDGDGVAIAVGSVMPDPHPREPARGDWRVRGMATREDMRRRGLAAAVLVSCERHARAQGGRRLWCNARIGARALYERGGLEVESDVFEIASIGPHYLMSKRLD